MKVQMQLVKMNNGPRWRELSSNVRSFHVLPTWIKPTSCDDFSWIQQTTFPSHFTRLTYITIFLHILTTNNRVIICKDPTLLCSEIWLHNTLHMGKNYWKKWQL
jgi:hypothetical protein